MAIPIGTNDLKIYRRHAGFCIRYAEAPRPDTYRPQTKKEEKADTCSCPIWCRGYLRNETEERNGILRAKRVFASLDATDWALAEKAVANLYTIGKLPSASVATIPSTGISVKHACERYLTSRTAAEGSLDPLDIDTLTQYENALFNLRLIPFAKSKGIELIKDFESKDVCQLFTESWRQQRRNIGALMGSKTRETMFQKFRTFLKFCVEQGWLDKSGAALVKIKRIKGKKRFGLELTEYVRLLEAVFTPGLSESDNAETYAAVELMRWSGLRISDAHKFNVSEIVRNERKTSWNTEFIQEKTKTECVSPIPDHVVELLRALPGRTEDGKKYFVTCNLPALAERIYSASRRAQAAGGTFLHHFSPHCLRHTFAIQHRNIGTPVEFVSRWLGHSSTAVTLEHYDNWLKSTQTKAEDVSRAANARMMAQSGQDRKTRRLKIVA